MKSIYIVLFGALCWSSISCSRNVKVERPSADEEIRYEVFYRKDGSFFRHGVYKEFWKGEPKVLGYYKNGWKDSLWKYYQENGNIYKIGSYHFGKMDGRWTYYDKVGMVENEVRFKAGLNLDMVGDWKICPHADLASCDTFRFRSDSSYIALGHPDPKRMNEGPFLASGHYAYLEDKNQVRIGSVYFNLVKKKDGMYEWLDQKSFRLYSAFPLN